MSKSNRKRITEFNFSGELRKIIRKQDKIKYLQLATTDRQYWIKVTKSRRDNLEIAIGCQLKVTGNQKEKLKTGKIEFTAHTIEEIFLEVRSPETLKIKPKAKILVCQKSNCWQRGGKAICQQLKQICRDRDLDGAIDIKMTGCLGKCGQAPNIVMLPDKTRHSNIKPKQIPALVEKHLVSNLSFA